MTPMEQIAALGVVIAAAMVTAFVLWLVWVAVALAVTR